MPPTSTASTVTSMLLARPCQVLHFHYPLTSTAALWGRLHSAYFTDDIHRDKYPARSDRRWWTWNSNPGPFNSKAWATIPLWQIQEDRKNAAGASTIRNKTDKKTAFSKRMGNGFGTFLVSIILLLKKKKKGYGLAVCSLALLCSLSWKDWLSTTGASAVLEKGSNNFL